MLWKPYPCWRAERFRLLPFLAADSDNPAIRLYASLKRLCQCHVSEESRMRGIGRFLQDERGATAIEYGLICAIVFLGVVGAIQVFGSKTVGMYDNIVSAM
jgi:pilus assembly protein Flp/PilA